MRPARRELTPQQSADFSGLGVEHFGKDLCVVAVPGEPWFQFINVLLFFARMMVSIASTVISFWPTL